MPELLKRNGESCHVPPMLFVIYLTWGVFFFLAARQPLAYASFFNFTMWANLFHGLLMVGQAAMMMDHYWSKFFYRHPICSPPGGGHLLLVAKENNRAEQKRLTICSTSTHL